MNLWSNGDSLQFTAISRAKPDTDLFRLSQFFQGYPGQFFGHVRSVSVVLIFSQEIILVDEVPGLISRAAVEAVVAAAAVEAALEAAVGVGGEGQEKGVVVVLIGSHC